jgi:hypothetical protein
MRISALTLSLTCIAVTPVATAAQETVVRQDLETRRFEVSVPVWECEMSGKVLADTINVPAGSQFVYLQDRPVPNSTPARTVAVIQFLRWTDPSDSGKIATFNTPRTGQYGTKTFCADKEYFANTTVRTYKWGWRSADFAAGVLILPIKIRLGGKNQAFDFSRDVTLGTVVGSRWRLSPTSASFLSLLGGAGITAVSLTP